MISEENENKVTDLIKPQTEPLKEILNMLLTIEFLSVLSPRGHA